MDKKDDIYVEIKKWQTWVYIGEGNGWESERNKHIKRREKGKRTKEIQREREGEAIMQLKIALES